jgi:hypothetical protein
MKYIKIKDGNITYPYTLQNLYSDNPNVSFISNLSSDVLENYDVYQVALTSKPEDYTKNITEGTPILVSGSYKQVWNETSASVEEIQERIEEKWIEVRRFRESLLKESDWTQLQDSPITGSKLTEWQTYRQSLRDITTNDNPFTLTWPNKPE